MLMVWILSMKAWAAPSCARLKRMNNIRTNVNVVGYKPKVVYRRIPRSQLIRKSGDKDTLGLTVAPLISSMEIQTAIIDRGDTLCVFIEDVTYRIGYKQQLVYIDKKYAPSTCPYNVILEHETACSTTILCTIQCQFVVKMHFRSVDALEVPKVGLQAQSFSVGLPGSNSALKQIQRDLCAARSKHGRIDLSTATR